jgi:putative oxidoreductase
MSGADRRGLRTPAVPGWLQKFDNAFIEFLRRYSLLALRIALGTVFVWFGALKVLGVSPVESLVIKTLEWLPPAAAVKGLGAVEVVIGALLVSGWAIRVTLFLFFVQMLGTFLVFIMSPETAFDRGNPLLLTQTGEFVVKNLILIAAGMTIAAGVPGARRGQSLHDMIIEKPEAGLPSSR